MRGAAGTDLSPRCLAPMRHRVLAGRANDADPLCWRRAGHAEDEEAAGRPARHMSRASWMHAAIMRLDYQRPESRARLGER
jgi:hypothetical protein